jgi:outer membrane protein TolC
VRRIIATVVVTFWTIPNAACPDPTLRESWDQVAKNHPALAASRSREEARAMSVAATNASLWPRLDATGSWAYVSEVPELELSLPLTLPDGTSPRIRRTLGDHDRAEAGLQASWTLFSGFSSLHAKRREQGSLEAVRWEGAQVRTDLATRLGLLDIALRREAIELRLRRERVASREAAWTRWKVRADNGSAVRSQERLARADLLRAVADTVGSHRVRDSLQTEFVELVGKPWNPGPLDSASVVPCLETVPGSPGESRQERALKSQASAFDQARSATLSSRWPVVVASAGARVGDPGPNTFGSGWTTWTVAGVQAQWNLFDGFERRAGAGRWHAEARALENEAARAGAVQRTRWTQGRSELDLLSDERAAVTAALEAAQEARAATSAAVAAGSAIPDDLLEAELRESEMRARLDLLRLREASLALRLRALSGEPLSFEGRP